MLFGEQRTSGGREGWERGEWMSARDDGKDMTSQLAGLCWLVSVDRGKSWILFRHYSYHSSTLVRMTDEVMVRDVIISRWELIICCNWWKTHCRFAKDAYDWYCWRVGTTTSSTGLLLSYCKRYVRKLWTIKFIVLISGLRKTLFLGKFFYLSWNI